MAGNIDKQLRALEQLLQQRGWTHLHAKKRGQTLTVFSGPPDEPQLRLTLLQPGLWRLDLRHHAGRWQPTPLTGSVAEMIEAAASMARLEDHGPPGPGNWGDSSGPQH